MKKVSQFVKIIASPKHPQSETGLVIASINVNTVKNDIKITSIQVASLYLYPNNSEIPTRNSVEERRMASGRLKDMSILLTSTMSSIMI